MSRRMLSLLRVFACLIVSAISQSGRFINPPPGPCNESNVDDAQSYNIGDEVLLRWTTNLPSMNVVLWQGVDGTSNTNFDIPGAHEYSGQSINWSVSPLGYDLSANPIFHLSVFVPGATRWIFSSACIKITNYGNVQATQYLATPSPTSSMTDSTTLASTSSTVMSNSTSATASGTASSIPSQPASSSSDAPATATAPTSTPNDRADSLSTGTKAGIGIGAAAVGVLAIGLGIFLCLKRRNSSGSGSASMPWASSNGQSVYMPASMSEVQDSSVSPPYTDGRSYENQTPAQLDDIRSPVELTGDQGFKMPTPRNQVELDGTQRS